MSLSMEQSTPLLAEEEGPVINKKASDLRWRLSSISLLAYSIIVTTLLVYLQIQSSHSNIPYSPARGVLRTSSVKAHLDGKSILTSDPSPEMHNAWSDLISPAYVNATEEEIKLSGGDPRTTVKLGDGNYLAVFGVYHQLHCMRWLYYLAHEEVYWRNMTSEQRTSRRNHGKHCIQTIVEYLMCKPDTALYPVGLDPKAENALQLMPGAEWQCVNWDSVHKWALGRSQGYTPEMFKPDAYLDELRRSAPQ